MAWALIAVAVALLAFFIVDDIREFARFKALDDTVARQRRFRLWVAKSFVLFTGYTLAALLLIGRFDALWSLPPEFARLGDALPPSPLILIIAGAVLAGSLLGAVIATRASAAEPGSLPYAAMLPRNAAERWHAALISLNAGVSEELFFRLALPLLVTVATGGAIGAIGGFVASMLLFGMAHAYQGIAGVVGTGLASLLFTILYVGSGSLLLPIAVHVVIDLNGMILRPWLARRADRPNS